MSWVGPVDQTKVSMKWVTTSMAVSVKVSYSRIVHKNQFHYSIVRRGEHSEHNWNILLNKKQDEEQTSNTCSCLIAKPNHADYFANTWRSERRTPLRKRRIFCDRQMCATGSAVAGRFHSFNPKKPPVCAFLSTPHCGRPTHVLPMSLTKGRFWVQSSWAFILVWEHPWYSYFGGQIWIYCWLHIPLCMYPMMSPLSPHYMPIISPLTYIKQDPNFKRVPLILAGALFRLWQQPFRLGGAGKKEPRTIRQWWDFPKNIYSVFNLVPHLGCLS